MHESIFPVTGDLSVISQINQYAREFPYDSGPRLIYSSPYFDDNIKLYAQDGNTDIYLLDDGDWGPLYFHLRGGNIALDVETANAVVAKLQDEELIFSLGAGPCTLIGLRLEDKQNNGRFYALGHLAANNTAIPVSALIEELSPSYFIRDVALSIGEIHNPEVINAIRRNYYRLPILRAQLVDHRAAIAGMVVSRNGGIFLRRGKDYPGDHSILHRFKWSAH